MRRVFHAAATALLASATFTPGTASAQESVPSIEVRARFFHSYEWADEAVDPPWNDSSWGGDRFGFGESIRVQVELTNTGTTPLTGVNVSLEFARGHVTSARLSYVDLEPGRTEANRLPFEFSYGESVPWERMGPTAWRESACFLDLTANPPDELVIDDPAVSQDEVVIVDDPENSSDDFLPISPGRLQWHITTDQGTFEHQTEWEARCYVTMVLAGHYDFPEGVPSPATPGRLAATGSRHVVALVGISLVLGGIAMRRRAGTMAVRP